VHAAGEIIVVLQKMAHGDWVARAQLLMAVWEKLRKLAAANDGKRQGRPCAEVARLVQSCLPGYHLDSHPVSLLGVVTPSCTTALFERRKVRLALPAGSRSRIAASAITSAFVSP
jgi:hypothetical protein